MTNIILFLFCHEVGKRTEYSIFNNISPKGVIICQEILSHKAASQRE
jgi:hypothetical protein